jgi:transcriptional regulator with XRE-family HTH domain
MIPRQLQKWRQVNGISQAKLAKLLGVDVMTVSRWERGVVNIPSFLHLALDVLECKAKEVKEEKGKRKRKGGVKHGKYLQTKKSKNRMGK